MVIARSNFICKYKIKRYASPMLTMLKTICERSGPNTEGHLDATHTQNQNTYRKNMILAESIIKTLLVIVRLRLLSVYLYETPSYTL